MTNPTQNALSTVFEPLSFYKDYPIMIRVCKLLYWAYNDFIYSALNVKPFKHLTFIASIFRCGCQHLKVKDLRSLAHSAGSREMSSWNWHLLIKPCSQWQDSQYSLIKIGEKKIDGANYFFKPVHKFLRIFRTSVIVFVALVWCLHHL